jgi:hypothetical protein
MRLTISKVAGAGPRDREDGFAARAPNFSQRCDIDCGSVNDCMRQAIKHRRTKRSSLAACALIETFVTAVDAPTRKNACSVS